jgi:hypothetical protein
MMIYRVLLIILAISALFISCEKGNSGPVTPGDEDDIPPGNGLYILNEGNYGRGNGSVSFWHADSNRVFNTLFLTGNNRQPGDIPFTLYKRDNKGYLIVNNSGKIEIVNLSDFKSLKTITGLTSPRFIVPINNNKGYISSLYSDSIALFCFSEERVISYINIGTSSEQITVIGDYAYIASWSFNNRIIVVDTGDGSVVKEIIVEYEPESMVTDRDGMLWVLCSGGFMNQGTPALIVIDPVSNSEVRRILFPENDYPTNLRIDMQGEVLYYLNSGIYMLPITAVDLPAEPFIEQGSGLFYRMEIFYENGDIFVTDAKDYQRRGSLLRYNNEGLHIEDYETGIIPGIMTERER